MFQKREARLLRGEMHADADDKPPLEVAEAYM
jgi:hypothetical protein